MHQSVDGTLWFGTKNRGLFRRRQSQIVRVNHSPAISKLIRALYEDDRGHLWIGSEDQGLTWLDTASIDTPAEIRAIRIDQSRGLYSDTIHQILPDDRGYLWMSSNHGLFRVALQQLREVVSGQSESVRCRFFTERHGMPSREANGGVQGAGIRTRDGRLWFPTQRGVAIVDPDDIDTGVSTPRIQIEGIRKPGALLPDPAQSIRLAKDQRNLEIAYTATSLADPGQIAFRYRLEGFDQDWVPAAARRFAIYTNLPPGQFRFRVQGRYADGPWAEADRVLEIVAPYVLYETPWLRALTAGLLGLIVLTAATGLGYRFARATAGPWQGAARRRDEPSEPRDTVPPADRVAVDQAPESGSEDAAPPQDPTAEPARRPTEHRPTTPQTTSVDKVLRKLEKTGSRAAFLARLEAAVGRGFSDPDFDVGALARQLSMDRSHLFRQMRGLLGVSPSEYLRAARLDASARALRASSGSVAEVAEAVGFRNVSHFSRCFRARHGCSPASYRVGLEQPKQPQP